MIGLTVAKDVSAKYTVQLHYNVKDADGNVPDATDFKGVIQGNDYYKVVDVSGFTAPNPGSRANGVLSVENTMTEEGRFTFNVCMVVNGKYKKLTSVGVTVFNSATSVEDGDVLTDAMCKEIIAG